MTPKGPAFSHAVSWSFVMEVGRQSLNVIITFILAALLGPEAYGLAAMALVFITFVDLLQRQGMAAALIQRKDLSRSHRDTAFWLLMLASVLLLMATVAGARWWAGINDLPELRVIIIGLSPMIPLQGLSVVQDALLRRQMAFKQLAQRTLVAVLAGGITGLVSALAGWGVWALVVQQVTQAGVAAIVLWSISDWRPGFDVSLASAKDLMGFASGSFLSSLASFVNNQADALLIGLFFGPLVVGIYRLGLRMVETLVSALTRPIQAISLPELAPCQDDPPQLRRRVERLARLAAVTTLPSLGVLAAAANPGVEWLGGDWAAAAAVAQVLCIVGAVRAIVVIDGPLLLAVGSPFIQAGFAAVAAVVSAASFVAAGTLVQGLPTEDQALGIAIARAIVWGMAILTMHVIIMRRFGHLSLKQMLAPVMWPTIAGLAATGTGVAIDLAMMNSPAPLRLLTVSLVGLIVAGTIVLLTVPAVTSVIRIWVRRPVPASNAPDASDQENHHVH